MESWVFPVQLRELPAKKRPVIEVRDERDPLHLGGTCRAGTAEVDRGL